LNKHYHSCTEPLLIHCECRPNQWIWKIAKYCFLGHILCGSYCRTMAKRAAETYLTDQNWDKEQAEEEVKDFMLFRN